MAFAPDLPDPGRVWGAGLCALFFFPVGGAETGSISNRDRFVKSLADHHLIFYQRRDRMQSPPADDMAIVELLLIDRPAAFLGIAKDRPADRRYPGDQRGYVIDEGH